MTPADRAPAFDPEAWLSVALAMQGLAAADRNRAAVVAALGVAHHMLLDLPDDCETS